ncbi:anhydro-N-acetylmuramic acid kinase [Gammaproteobacteria bacterium]|nr:anhydro-N-acetylmuramic acid kinase [Gammaproteobacteria bacterium]
MSKYYLGVMCGTSLDSIDISIINAVGKKFKVFGFKEYQLSQKFKDEINSLKSSNPKNIEVNNFNIKITTLIISQVKNILKKYKLAKRDISAIGYAGITLDHRPDLKKSLYLGNPEMLSSMLSIPVISDFRQTDIDAGGQGAPLTGLFHKHLNTIINKDLIYLNLGGFANVSIPNKLKLMSYDVGPANYLIDIWCREKFDIEFDLNGRLASMGEIDSELLKLMLKDKYFTKKPPKSTGFELFNINWIKKHLKKSSFSRDINILATLTYLTVITVSNEINKYTNKPSSIFFYGGGAFNKLIVQGIIDLTKLKKVKSLRYGIDEKNLEATAFAWLASIRMNKIKFPKSEITGTSKSYYLGNIY